MRWSDELLAVAKRLQDGLGIELPVVGLHPKAKPAASAGVADRDYAGMRLRVDVPTRVGRRPPLVMLLHGCQQDAATFARESGWLEMCRSRGAILALPEQSSSNNSQRCFNWFRTDDASTGRAELAALREMLTDTAREHGCDPQRLFVVGLSAGGAMAASLMAACPDLIAAGAVVAGLPVGCARNLSEALGRMASAEASTGDHALALQARKLAPAGFTGPWPRLSVWHGSADQVVDPDNGAQLVRQWRALAGLHEVPAEDLGAGSRVRVRRWLAHSAPVLEWWSLAGMDHGYPVGLLDAPGRWVLPSEVSATERVADFLGIPAR